MTPRLPYGRGWACKRQAGRQRASGSAVVYAAVSTREREQACTCSNRLNMQQS